MINFFVEQIVIGRITTEDVPMLWRAKVQAKLDEMNKDIDHSTDIPGNIDKL